MNLNLKFYTMAGYDGKNMRNFFRIFSKFSMCVEYVLMWTSMTHTWYIEHHDKLGIGLRNSNWTCQWTDRPQETNATVAHIYSTCVVSSTTTIFNNTMHCTSWNGESEQEDGGERGGRARGGIDEPARRGLRRPSVWGRWQTGQAVAVGVGSTASSALGVSSMTGLHMGMGYGVGLSLHG
jgi:hypothetical protein